MEYQANKAILVGICTDDRYALQIEKSLCELERLLETAGGQSFAKMIQNKDKPDPRTLSGSGKVSELKELCENNGIELVVFDEELTPSRIRNLEEDLGKEVRVLDRSMLILDIFALHAATKEGKLQVELAQLKYTAPRLTGHGTELSRLGGGIGTRGPGESKLETDRRHMRRRITALETELEELEGNRRTMRAARDRSGLSKIAIVGYTNAGKSTLLNALTNAGILAEDKLFATLDPTTRKYELPNGESVLLTDTVGFIRKLPHHLIHAFKSTLDEAVYADALIIVIDASDPEHPEQIKVTEELLRELGASGKPTLYVFNKCDLGAEEFSRASVDVSEENVQTVAVSAKTGKGLDQLLTALQALLMSGKRRVVFHIPNNRAGVLNTLYQNAAVEDVEYGAEEILATAIVDRKTHGMLRQYDPRWQDPEEE
ncbi:MAG: GTPase HflX [Clostridia bacterium]|nr:GTPase HflX [Clostridia bacterium]